MRILIPKALQNKALKQLHTDSMGIEKTRMCESVGADIFAINNKHNIYIADYHSKFPVKKQVEDFNADNLIKHTRLSFQNIGCPVK